MPNVLHLTIASPEKVLFDGEVKYIHVPGGAGFLGVLVDHAPLLASLQPGPFEVRPVSGEAFTFKTSSSGLFEVIKNKASILLDAADTGVLR